MNKPIALVDLLKELEAEGPPVNVTILDGAYATLTDAEDETVRLTGEEAARLFDTPDSVERLAEALTDAESWSIEFHGLAVPSEVMDALERTFCTADEV